MLWLLHSCCGFCIALLLLGYVITFPLLTGKAQSVYVAINIDTLDYAKKIRYVVLQKFEILAETDRMRFHSSVLGEETQRQMQVHLKALYL